MINVEPVPGMVLETDADAYVRRDLNTHGGETTVVVKRVDDNPDNTYNRTGWIHFDLSTFSYTHAVQLRLPIDASSGSSPSGKLKVWGIVDGRPGDALGTDWTEAGITAGNAPVSIPFAEGSNTTLIAEIACGAPGEDMLISGDALLAFLAADTNGEVTFVLSREVDNVALVLRSKESASGGATLEAVKLYNADAYVRGGSSADNNFGSSDVLEIKNLASNLSYTRESFLRFVYDDVTEPITSATLKLFLKSKDSDSGNVRIRLLDDADDYWAEAGITWNTKSAGIGTEISIPVSNLQAGVEYSVDVAALLAQSINSNKTASFHLDLDTETAVSFYSREATLALAPKLDIRTADTDHDGIPDDWENDQGLDPLVDDAAGNPDGDAHNNFQEYIAGTAPTNAASCFSVSNAWKNASGDFVIEWAPSISNRLYSVWWAPTLTNSFQTLETEIELPQNSYTDTVHSAEFKNFYKVKVELK